VDFRSGGEQPWTLKAENAEAIFAPGSVLSQVIAKKQVRVRDGDRTINSQLLKLFFDKKGDAEESTISRAVANRDVTVHYAGETALDAAGDDLEWDARTDKYRLTGKPARIQKGSIAEEGPTFLIDRGTGRISMPPGETPGTTHIEE